MVHHDYSFTNKHACFSSYEVQPAPKKKATTSMTSMTSMTTKTMMLMTASKLQASRAVAPM